MEREIVEIIKNKVKETEREIINWRRDLHKIPELAHDVPKTADYIIKQLEALGIEYKERIGGYGVIGIIYGAKTGKTFAIRADMDGLAVEEETGLYFSSVHKGKMHACGHDAHMAMALGGAKVLQTLKEEFAGCVKFIFQPAEEGPGGAKPMIDQHALKNPDVDVILGQHIGNIFKEVGNGQVGIAQGTIMASLDSFKIAIKGKGGHGAMPDVTIDPIVISAQIIQALQTLISREIKPSHPGVITIGKIHGGTAYNVIPEKVEMEGTARFIHDEDRQILSKRIGELTSCIASGMRGTCSYEYIYGYPALFCNKQFTDFFKIIAEKIIGEENVVSLKDPTMGGEDMAYFLKEIPGTYFFLGSVKENEEIYPHHHPKFDINESVLWKGSALLAATAYSWLNTTLTLSD